MNLIKNYILLFLLLPLSVKCHATTIKDIPYSLEQNKSQSSAIIETNLGNITISFFEKTSPLTTAHFKSLVKRGWYTNKSFYRIVPDLLVQAGAGLERDLSGVSLLKGEFTSSHKRGTVSFARKQNPDSANTEFFICLNNSANKFDGMYAAFAQVIDGFEVLDAIANSDIEENYVEIENIGKVAFHKPVIKIKIHKITLLETAQFGRQEKLLNS